jgi:hypothetical protein
MTFDTSNITPIQPTEAIRVVAPVRETVAAVGEDDGGPVKVDTLPSSPPPEVLRAVGHAAAAYDRLVADGLQLRFGIDGQTGRVALHVYDHNGGVLGTLAPSQVLDIAYNGNIE